MKSVHSKYLSQYYEFDKAIDEFLMEVGKHKLSDMTTKEWTVKDQLCHIVFWHDYYAQNYAAMAANTKPFLFVSKGGSTRNQEGVNKLKMKSVKKLISILDKARRSLYQSIVIKQVPNMIYIVGTNYTTERFLEMITHHILRHAILVRRAKTYVDM